MPSPAEIHALLQEPLRLGRGRRVRALQVEDAGELGVEDLLAASVTPHEKTGEAVVLELRQSHHHVARLIAKGAKNNEVSAITGLTPSRISTLKSDPAFKELLAYYSEMDETQYENSRADMHIRLASLGFDSIEILHERIHDDPSQFDVKTLLAIVEATADRTGHGKTSTVNHDHAHSLSPHTIAALKADANASSPIAEADRGALLRIAADRTAAVNPEAEEADWIEGSGSCVREEVHSVAEAPLRLGSRSLS